MSSYTVGSSPLARGTRPSMSELFFALRLIPARAGNTPPSILAPGIAAAHPRSRGEHRSWRRFCRLLPGSSPLARGTLGKQQLRDYGRRLIPARAGNTRSVVQRRCTAAAHPRSRGEHIAWVRASPARRGSSPLARGTRYRASLRYRPHRLIPARAGNTAIFRLDVRSVSAHPRSRGEHRSWRRFVPWLFGSSPLARGTPLAPTTG